MRILVVKISSMGDIIHTLPALTDALHVFPDAHFDWVVEENFKQIPIWHPAVYCVIPVAIRRWSKNWFSSRVRYELNIFKYKLQQKKYDIVIDAQGLIKSAIFITRIALSDKKHGFDYKSACESIASIFYNKKHRVSKEQHAILRIRHLFAISLGYSIPTLSNDYSISNYFFSYLNKNNYLMFLHSTTHICKHWPNNCWQELIYLAVNAGYQIKLPWGEKHEYLRSQYLAHNIKEVEVLPYLTLTEIGSYIAGAKAIVSVDTGLSHLSVALDRPIITMYGPTNPYFIGVYGCYQQRCLCAKDGNMANIKAHLVWETLQLIL